VAKKKKSGVHSRSANRRQEKKGVVVGERVSCRPHWETENQKKKRKTSTERKGTVRGGADHNSVGRNCHPLEDRQRGQRT